MGRFGFFKMFLPFFYAFQALRIRFRRRPALLYYVPAPGKHPAFLRDCIVLGILRPFFPRIVFQWHAAGLSHWLETRAWRIERWIGRRLYRGSVLSIVQMSDKAEDAACFHPKALSVIPYGIPDPCPHLDVEARGRERGENTPTRLLFLSMATREKGVFDAVSVWQRLNRRAAAAGGPFYHLSIAGDFPDAKEAAEFREFLESARADIRRLIPNSETLGCTVDVVGPVHGERKFDTYARSDVFLFPSTYAWESFGVVLVEAAHFGLPCVTYQPLVGPGGLSPEFHRRAPSGDVNGLVEAIESLPHSNARAIREDALAKYNVRLFGERMIRAFEDHLPSGAATTR